MRSKIEEGKTVGAGRGKLMGSAGIAGSRPSATGSIISMVAAGRGDWAEGLFDGEYSRKIIGESRDRRAEDSESQRDSGREDVTDTASDVIGWCSGAPPKAANSARSWRRLISASFLRASSVALMARRS